MKNKHAKDLGRLFRKELIRWNKFENQRVMPWKGEKDPYRIWLSEIMLQQTRVEQGLSYYRRFVKEFPTVFDLAAASDTLVFKAWEGLGYYSRCKNLLATARFIVSEREGRFPDSYESILALKGVGPYTAAAIASFAYGLPHAVVDGNVYRVIARYFGLSLSTETVTGKAHFRQIAEQLLDTRNPGSYNQAIMDFGATICKPVNPLCAGCPLRKNCIAYAQDRVADFPVKRKKPRIKNRWILFLLFSYRGKIFIRKRTSGDVWENLFEFYPLELAKQNDPVFSSPETAIGKLLGKTKYKAGVMSKPYRQKLSHQLVHARFMPVASALNPGLSDWQAVPRGKLVDYPFPRIIAQYLKDEKMYL
jgi:A/G-specific adenine glycosylase